MSGARGDRDKRITIKRPEAGSDASGTPLPGWVDVVSLWANISYLSGVEAVRSDVVAAIAKASIRVQYLTGIDTSMRVVYRGTTFSIVSVLPDEAGHEHVDLVCETIT